MPVWPSPKVQSYVIVALEQVSVAVAVNVTLSLTQAGSGESLTVRFVRFGAMTVTAEPSEPDPQDSTVTAQLTVWLPAAGQEVV